MDQSPGMNEGKRFSHVVVQEPKHYARLISFCPEVGEMQLMRSHTGTHSGHGEREFVYTLGRSSACDFRFNDKHISTVHCRMFCMRNYSNMEMDVFIEDDSANGTYIYTGDTLRGARRLPKGVPQRLCTGDEVSLINPICGQQVPVEHSEPAGRQVLLSRRPPQDNKRAAFLVVLSHGHFRHIVGTRNDLAPASSASGAASEEAVETYLQNSQDYAQQYKARHSQHGLQADASSQSSGHSWSNSSSSCTVQALLQTKRAIYDYYDVSTDVLGTGTYATVREARRKSDGSIWAVKIISTRTLAATNSALILREAEMLRLLRHRCITHLEDVFQDSKNVYLAC